MDEFYSKMPVVKAVVYNDETVVEIVTEFWKRGYFVKIKEENSDLMLVMEQYDSSPTGIMPGQYVVFSIDPDRPFSFEVVRWDEFHHKYERYIPKEENTHG